MNIIADENIAHQVVDRLREDGHDVRYTTQGQSISDDIVLETANQQKALIVTDDKDFGELVIRQRRKASGVILVRLAGLSSQQRAEIVANVVRENGNRLIGSITVITQRQVRIRPLDASIRLIEPNETDS